MAKGVLVNMMRCTGCRSCQVACKAWNDNPGELTVCLGCYDNPHDLSADTWSLVRFSEVETSERLHWVFAKRQCMHCLEPACVTVCPTKALHKTSEGPVVYSENRCIGCQYCAEACPFSVPAFDWEEKTIKKCTFCIDRITNGLEPACVKGCPTGGLTFGDRDELLKEANELEAGGAHLYGRDEVGGASWIYASIVPFEELGFARVGQDTSYPAHSRGTSISQMATVIVGAAAIGAYSLFLRRRKLAEGEEE